MRSLEIAKGNLNSMGYVLDSSKKEIQIRKLTVQIYGLSCPKDDDISWRFIIINYICYIYPIVKIYVFYFFF